MSLIMVFMIGVQTPNTNNNIVSIVPRISSCLLPVFICNDIFDTLGSKLAYGLSGNVISPLFRKKIILRILSLTTREQVCLSTAAEQKE